MALINKNIKSITCSEFRVLIQKLVKDKIEKEWTENYIDEMNFVTNRE